MIVTFANKESHCYFFETLNGMMYLPIILCINFIVCFKYIRVHDSIQFSLHTEHVCSSVAIMLLFFKFAACIQYA